MKNLKTIFVILASIHSLASAMSPSKLTVHAVQKNQSFKKLIFTHHACKRMRERGITRDDIVSTIQVGQSSKIENDSAYLYKKKIKKRAQHLMVIAKPCNRANKMIIITSYFRRITASKNNSNSQKI